MRERRATPRQPVFYGQIHFGVFREPFERLNLVDADIYGHRWAPRWWRNLRLKEWQHFCILDDDFICGFAVLDFKFMGISFFYVYDRIRHQVIEHKRTTLQRRAIQVPELLYHGDGYFRQPGYQITLQNRLRQGLHHLRVDIQSRGKLPSAQASFTLYEDLTRVQPLIAVLPVNNYRRPMVTHKVVCPVEGSLQVGDRKWTLSAEKNRALVDVQKTFYPYNTFWKWAAFAGSDQNGQPVAVNLTQNMIIDDEEWNECCAWIDGQINLLGAARFDYDPRSIQQPWRIVTTDGHAEFVFTPEGERAGLTNLAGLIRSDFCQLFGTYRGYFVDDAGQRHDVDGAVGLVEHHVLKA